MLTLLVALGQRKTPAIHNGTFSFAIGMGLTELVPRVE